MNTQLRDQQLQTLSEVLVVSFTANPNTVRPFGKTVVSWKVQLPPGPIGLVLGTSVDPIGDRPVKATGAMTVPVSGANTEFFIVARMSLASLAVGSVVVSVDTAECVPGTLAADLFAAGVKAKVDNAFAGYLASGGSVVKPGVNAAGAPQEGVVSIDIPTNQGADVSIELSIGSGANHTVGVALDTLDVAVSGSILDVEGCANKIKDVVAAFMAHIVNSEMIPAIAGGLQSRVIDPAAAGAKQNDTQHRDFVLTSFNLTSDAISFSLCPA